MCALSSNMVSGPSQKFVTLLDQSLKSSWAFLKLCWFGVLVFVFCYGLEAKESEEVALSSSGKFHVSGDVLFWFASEETHAIWGNVLSAEVKSDGIFTTFEGKGASFDWNYGFRMGAGYCFARDDWDTTFNWTWYASQSRSTIPMKDQVIFPQFFGGFINGDLADRAKLDWKLRFSMFDWDLGRSFSVSRSLVIRPFLGIKGGWINQSLDSKWHTYSRSVDGVFVPEDYEAKESVENNFWGLGSFGGVNTKWKLGHSNGQYFSLCGDFSLATLYGRWITKDTYKNPTPRKISTNIKNSDLGALMCRGFLGVGWDTDFNQGPFHFGVRAGYEMQVWFNQLRIATFQQLRLHGDLTLQGGTFSCRLDF